ncbi:MAG: hypothetical protein R6X13_07065, partial [bacterium]
HGPAELPTIVRGSLVLPRLPDPAAFRFLFSASGRRVMALAPGPNDVSCLAPGVYFLRGKDARGYALAGPGRRIIIPR